MNRRRYLLAASTLALLASATSAGTAGAGDSNCGAYDTCGTDTGYAHLGLLSRAEVLQLKKYPKDTGGPVVADPKPNDPVYVYRSMPDCYNARPGSATEGVTCAGALRSCPPSEMGPRLRIWRQTVAGSDVIEPWSLVGLTCAADVAPGARPTLAMADLIAAFKKTPWAKPQISSQPAGNQTLVNLKTFYKVNWTSNGYQPGEVDTSVLRGISVSIRPKLVGFTYSFGDGQSFGPTESTGGVYPSGDVTHVYGKPGAFPVRVHTTFGAEFSLDGATWDEIPETVTVPGPPTQVVAREAKAVLVNR